MLIGHCHLFPVGRGKERRDESAVPGTGKHLNAFMTAWGFDWASVLTPHGGPSALNLAAGIEGDRDGLEWLLEKLFTGSRRRPPCSPAPWRSCRGLEPKGSACSSSDAPAISSRLGSV